MEINGLRLECLRKERNLKLFSSKHAINSSFHFIRANVTSRFFLSRGYWLMKPFQVISLSNFIHIRYALRPSTYDEWVLQIGKTEISAERIESWESRWVTLKTCFLSAYLPFHSAHSWAESYSGNGWTFNNEGLRTVSSLVGNLLEIGAQAWLLPWQDGFWSKTDLITHSTMIRFPWR